MSLHFHLLFALSCALLPGKIKSQDVSPPQVYIGGYQVPEDTWTNFDSSSSSEIDENLIKLDEDGDISVVDPSGVQEIKVSCRAAYPVYWEMTDAQPNAFLRVVLRTEAIFDEADLLSGNSTSYEVKSYVTSLLLENEASVTGLYTCKSVDGIKGLEKAVHVFLPGLKNERAFASSKESEIGINGGNSILIPCKVTRKNREVALSKVNEEADPPVIIPMNATYDLKQGGFVIENTGDPDITGKYICSVSDSDSDDDKVTVRLVEDLLIEDDFSERILFDSHGKAGWRFRSRSNAIECCSNSSQGPDLVIVKCKNKPSCDVKKKILATKIGITPKTDGVVEVSLKEEGDPCVQTSTYYMIEPIIMQCKGDGVDIFHEFAVDYASAENKDSVAFSPATPNYTYSMNLSTQIEILKLINSTDKLGGIDLRFQAEGLTLDGPMPEIYEGDKFVIDCCGLMYHHAIGRTQLLGWKNGSVTKLQTPEYDRWGKDNPYAQDYCYFYRNDPEKPEYIVTADVNMDYFECIIPLLNDPRPSVIRIPLKIREPEIPEIVGSQDIEKVTFDQNQFGLLKLDCIFEKGLPTPKVTWIKDGVRLNNSDKLWSIEEMGHEKRGSILLFMRAIADIEGEYECKAENPYGLAQKTFEVEVRPRSYTDYWIALFIFGGFFVLIIFCALRITTLEKFPNPKKVEPM